MWVEDGCCRPVGKGVVCSQGFEAFRNAKMRDQAGGGGEISVRLFIGVGDRDVGGEWVTLP